MTRRDLFALIGAAAGGSVLYQAMTSLGHAAQSSYRPLALDGDAKGASVLVLGAGLAGMVAAYELRKAGYKVRVLEYGERAGGRCWSLRGGDRYTELGGFAQRCEFDKGLYLNPGPWRIPYHHSGVLDYCRHFKVALEPFVQVNYNAYLHSKDAFQGQKQRYRTIGADFCGGIAELLAKATNAGRLDDRVSNEDKEILLEALKSWGALDTNYAYRAGDAASERRGYDADRGGGLSGAPKVSMPVGLSDILKSKLWQNLAAGSIYEFQTTMFQPVGGMDMIAKAFLKEVEGLIRFHAKVTAIHQDAHGVTAFYEDTRSPGAKHRARADWCLCTIPLSILGQIELNVGAPMKAAIDAVPYVPAVKAGLQMKRRFWEEDEAIYGGITVTDLPIRNIGYPCSGYGGAKGVLLGCYSIFSADAFELTGLPPEERLAKVLDWGAMIHPQMKNEYECGMAVAWSRNPGSLGCFANWSDEKRKQHYANLCAIDGRIALAGEHASYLPAWQEGAVLSALDAVSRLHHQVMAG